MIKVEKLSPDALVYVNGLQVFRHQLFSHMDWQTVEVVQGNVTYSIDENEVRTMYAKVEDTSPPPVATTNKVLTDSVTATITQAEATPKINMRNAAIKKK
jgi:hypothetical protein